LINPTVRRWDQVNNDEITLVGGAVTIQEQPANGDLWIDLENGIQIEFSAGGVYRTGDYWLIPARVATGDIEWPPLLDASGNPELDADGNVIPEPLPPDGIEHHYAPLGFLSLSGKALTTGGCQCTFPPASPCFLIANKSFVPVRALGAGRLVAAQDAEERAAQTATVKKRQKKS
jgi:hypothetical protein